MAQESTQYGLKNKLAFAGFTEPAANHIQISLCHPDPEQSEGVGSNAKDFATAYLNIVFFSAEIIRFHYSFKKEFDLNYPNSDLEFKAFDLSQKHYTKIQEQSDTLSIEYPQGKILVNKNPLQVQVFNKNNELLSSDEPSLGFWSDALRHKSQDDDFCRTEIRCYKQYQNLENPPQIFGLGDKTGLLNRWGRNFRNAPIDALGYDSQFTDPLYKDIPFFIVRDALSKNSHGIFFDNFYEKFFDFGRERKPSPYFYFGAKGGEMNYYLIHGNTVSEIVSNYLQLTGRPPEWPDYSYGYLSSGMIYTENPTGHDEALAKSDAQEQLLQTFKRFKQNKIPSTAFHLSSGYIQDKNGKRQQFIWNKEKFPDVKAFVKSARQEGVELCTNLKPVLLCSHPWYEEAKKLDLFVNCCHPERSEGSNAQAKTGPLDPSPLSAFGAQDDTLVIDYWGGEGSIMDFRKTQTQKWWKEKIKENFFAHGIFGIWNDNNEYEIFEDHAAQGYEHIMANLMSKLSMEAFTEWSNCHPDPEQSEGVGSNAKAKTSPLDPSATPRDDTFWNLSRSGYAGIQKYAQTWTGDNYSSWKALQHDIPLMLSMSISGLIHVGDDIGGFWGGKFNENPDPELLLRWIQFGVFTPRFCIHSYKQTPTEPDMYKESHPEFFKVIQDFMALRTKLIPEIKAAADKASRLGVPIMRPCFYDFPDDENCYEQNFEYIFADKYLVAPIYQAQSESTNREIYLPGKNIQWQDYFSGEKYQGGKTISLKTQHDNIPIFISSN